MNPDDLARDLDALGLPPTATTGEARDRWRHLRHAWHPDRAPTPGDPRWVRRYQDASAAAARLASPPVGPVVPSRSAAVVSLDVRGPAAWRGGKVAVTLADGRVATVLVPPDVRPGAVIEIPGGLARVRSVDLAPWRVVADPAEPDALRGEVLVSLADILATGASVELPTPWERVSIELPRGRLELRLPGYGRRPPGRPAGALYLHLTIGWPPADPIVDLALGRHRHAPRLILP